MWAVVNGIWKEETSKQQVESVAGMAGSSNPFNVANPTL